MIAHANLTNRQKFDWGNITWIIEPDSHNTSRVSVGLVTFKPGKAQEEHGHLREEQVLYVLSGHGEHYIDGVKYPLHTGSYMHMPPHSRHILRNLGTEDLCMLIVYVPSKIHHLIHQLDIEDEPHDPFPGQTVFDVELLGPIMHRLSQALGLSLMLLDTEGNCILRTDNCANMCNKLSEVTGGAYCREHLRNVFSEISDYNPPHFFECCCNVASIIIPVAYSGTIMAYLRCGDIILSSTAQKEFLKEVPKLAATYNIDEDFLLGAALELPIEPKSRLHSAAEATAAIANTLVNITAINKQQNALNASRFSLIKEQLATTKLEKALHESELKLLQSQLNTHFLFNTLSTISQMAYLEGAKKASVLTQNLSELLRYTLRKSEQLIPLHEEVSLIKHYMNIQRERFGERVKFSLNVGKGIDDVLVPCMILQPLVENAIIHGLEVTISGGCIKLDIRQRNNMLHVSIVDDGVGFDTSTLEHRSLKRVGLNSTRSRLQLYYEDNYTFNLHSKPGKGTAITLQMPLERDDGKN